MKKQPVLMTQWLLFISFSFHSKFKFTAPSMIRLFLMRMRFNMIGDVLLRKASTTSSEIEKASSLLENSSTVTYSTIKNYEGNLSPFILHVVIDSDVVLNFKQERLQLENLRPDNFKPCLITPVIFCAFNIKIYKTSLTKKYFTRLLCTTSTRTVPRGAVFHVCPKAIT